MRRKRDEASNDQNGDWRSELERIGNGSYLGSRGASNRFVYQLMATDDFILRAAEYGGCATPSQWDVAQQARANHIEKLFDKLTEYYLRSVVPPEAIHWVDSLKLDWINDESVNALAMFSGRKCRIAFFSGIVGRLWDAFVAVAAHPLHLKSVPGAIPPKEIFRLNLSQMVPKIIRRGADDTTRATLDSFASLASRRIDIVTDLYRVSVEFLLMHEIHHFWGGHLFYSQALRKRGLTQAESTSWPPLEPLLHQAFEWQADYLAVKRLVEAYALMEIDREVFLTNWITALAVLFLLFHPSPTDFKDHEASFYLHPHVRFLEIITSLCVHVQAAFDFSDEKFDAILSQAFAEVALIDVSGKNDVLGPFYFAFQNSAIGQQRSAVVRERLREALPLLEESRLQMLVFLAAENT